MHPFGTHRESNSSIILGKKSPLSLCLQEYIGQPSFTAWGSLPIKSVRVLFGRDGMTATFIFRFRLDSEPHGSSTITGCDI